MGYEQSGYELMNLVRNPFFIKNFSNKVAHQIHIIFNTGI